MSLRGFGVRWLEWNAKAESGTFFIRFTLCVVVFETMTYFTTWEEFAKAAERLYMNDPLRVRAIWTQLIPYGMYES